jgi:hypothetical protein
MISLRYIHWYEHKETIASGNGEDIYIGGKPVTCTVITSGNTGKFQFSTSPKSDLEADTATWQDWAKGNVTATTSDALTSPVTAVRGVSVTGEIKIEVVI